VKIEKKPQVTFYPCPVVLVTSCDENAKPNIITLSWVGVTCSDPPMIGVAIRPQRYSYQLIKKMKEFVINIPTVDVLKQTDFCGMISGQKYDKFSESGLTPEIASKVKPPLIRECPVNLECILKNAIKLGTHDLFLGEIVSVHIDSNVLNEKGDIDYSKLSPIIYMPEEYWSLGKRLGVYGFSRKTSK